MKSIKSLRYLTESGVIAAMYAALSLCLAPFSFGPIQFRAAEMLTLLPIYTPAAIPGLAVGCAITNGVGMAMGTNMAGAMDLLCGTAATGIAAVVTRLARRVRLGNWPVLAAVPPILFNALVVGTELAWVLFSPFSVEMWALCMAEVGMGQLLACGGGLVLCRWLERTGAAGRLFKTGERRAY